MKNSIIFTFLFCGVSSFSAFGQSDIGVFISSHDLNRIAFEWRKPISEKTKFKIGLTAGGYGKDVFGGYPESSIMNDTLQQTFTHYSVSRVSLKLGLERQIKSSIFYYGVDLLPGFQSSYNAYNYTETPVNQDTTWAYPTFNNGPDGGVTYQYLSANILGTIGLNFPISDRFILNLAGNIGLDTKFYLAEKNRTDPKGRFNTLPMSTVNSYISGTIGLRYKFSKKEN